MNANVSTSLREMLDAEVQKRNNKDELCEQRPDPLLVAREYSDDRIALICALFAYGNAKKIVEFLYSLDFELLKADDEVIKKALQKYYYRFQSSQDIAEFFITLKRIGKGNMNDIFLQGYNKKNDVLDGLFSLLEAFSSVNSYSSRGYRFLTSQIAKKRSTAGAYKRWMMFLRWMVRKDDLDLGYWHGIKRSDLVIPLDTHTFHVSRSLGLLTRKSCDWKAAIELTEKLKTFDADDPIKYDFAIYRIGQEKLN